MLPDADIRGHFRCTGARLDVALGDSSPAVSDPKALDEYGPYALVADGLKVSGDVRLDGGFTALGVLLSSAHIGDKLDCRGAILTAAPNAGYGLRASGARIGGDLILDKCTAEGGGIRLSDVKIAGELLCHGSQLKGGDKGRNAHPSRRGLHRPGS
jgi:hypothetical protein